MLIKYIKSVLWRVAKRLFYIEDARCLKINILGALYFNIVLVIHCQNRFYLSLSIVTLDSALSIFLSSLHHLLLLPIQRFCHISVQDSLIGLPAVYCDYFYNRTTTCFLRQADHSSRGVLPTVVRRCVWSRNLDNGKALANRRTVTSETNGLPPVIAIFSDTFIAFVLRHCI